MFLNLILLKEKKVTHAYLDFFVKADMCPQPNLAEQSCSHNRLFP